MRSKAEPARRKTSAAPALAPDGCSPTRPRRLPVLPGGRLQRRFAPGPWRTGVLLAVHALFALHLTHWLMTGWTVTPVEPSEAMEFSKHAVVNAGLIFFALAIASTVLLGRWFCGWGCHVVALQDLSRWLLRRMRIQPRPLRSGLLSLVPLAACLYMFAGPLLYRWLSGAPTPVLEPRLMTDDFWATFPSWIPALLTFLVCGFVCVYLLGQKGFCTNGCPYGGAFAAADQLAPLRIRVTQDCNQCGHCTAVCTSNVRVHEEVRDFGAVVDPGCMKCLDCVSVCPNEALYVGLGAPAVLQGGASAERRHARRSDASASAARQAALARWSLRGAFCLLTALLLVGFDRGFAWRSLDLLVSGGLTLLTLLIVALLPVRGRAPGAPAIHEELALAAGYLGGLLVFRGLYGISLLFALGIAACTGLLALQALRLLTLPSASLLGRRMRVHGRYQRASLVFAALLIGLAGFMVHSGVVQHHVHAVRRALLRLADGASLSPGDVRIALQHIEAAERRSLIPARLDRYTHAQLFRYAGDLNGYAERMRSLLQRNPAHAGALLDFAAHHARQGDLDTAAALYERHIAAWPRRAEAYAEAALLQAARGNLPAAAQRLRDGLQRLPAHPHLLLQLGLVTAEAGDIAGAADVLRQAVRADSRAPAARLALGRALLTLGEARAAEVELRVCLSLSPGAALEQEARVLLELALQAQARTPEASVVP